MNRLQFATLAAFMFISTSLFAATEPYIPTQEELDGGDVEIIAGEEKTVYEYRVAGRLMMIKVVPEKGVPYYMVPGDGSAHYESLDHSKKLYPKWVLIEW